jgi:N4-(beta-N-acetylglucosaminyl)-L-asparaginase
MERRTFLKLGAGLGAVTGLSSFEMIPAVKQSVFVSTWAPNVKANKAAFEKLANKGSLLDALVAGVNVPEADPEDNSVGYGGLPDREGKVTLDACIMNSKGQCGAVMALEHIMHPINVARLVMEKTPHVQLVGAGALQFALNNGFTKQDLLTEESKAKWQEWLKTSKYNPNQSALERMEKSKINHDTIGMIAMDEKSNLAGACTTSGLAYKMHGRVGDSPIIGAGLFVDNEVGAATGTGVGEEVVKVCGAHTIIEAMRYGKSPEQACKIALERIIKNMGKEKAKQIQVGFIALNKKGQVGAYSLTKNFTYVVTTNGATEVKQAKFLL